MSTSPTLWSFKDPYKTEIPSDNADTSKPEGNLWAILCEEQLKEDKERCEGWKDEIQNLLVFAGLFSAVVTTFVVDSYKNIQPDSQADAVVLLAQLVSHLAPDVHNNSISTAPIPPFIPDTSEVRVNVYWFLSLVVSLGTASAGITTLQWIREFQQYDPDLTSKQAFALRNLRAESFDNWQVPTIIATLPFLIQVALVLFLIGLSDFLFNSVSTTVAFPSAVLSGIIIFCLLLSIVLPTLQHLALLSGVFNKDIPTPCPYRSPPGWGYFRIMYGITTHVLPLSRGLGGLFFVIKDLLFPPNPPKSRTDKSKPRPLLQTFKELYRKHLEGIWSKHPNSLPYDLPWGSELEWLLKRDDASHASTTTADSSQNRQEEAKEVSKFDLESDIARDLLPVEYDAARGLAFMVDRSFRGRSTPYALYNCFRDLPTRVKGKSFFDRMSNQGGSPRRGLEALYENPDPLLVQAENLMFFLDSFEQTRTTSLKHKFADHQLELCVRVMGGTFTAKESMPKLRETVRGAGLDGGQSDLWLPKLLTHSGNGLRRLSQLNTGDLIREQILLVYQNFVASSKAVQPLAQIDTYHTFQQIVPLTELISHTIQDILSSSSDEEERSKEQQSALRVVDDAADGAKSKRKQRYQMVERIGSNINRLFTQFLLENYGTEGLGDDTPFHKTTLYLAATVYITNLLNGFKDLTKGNEKEGSGGGGLEANSLSQTRPTTPNPGPSTRTHTPQPPTSTTNKRPTRDLVSLLQVRTTFADTSPQFIATFIDLLGAWVRKSSRLKDLHSVRIFKAPGWFNTKRNEVAELLRRLKEGEPGKLGVDDYGFGRNDRAVTTHFASPGGRNEGRVDGDRGDADCDEKVKIEDNEEVTYPYNAGLAYDLEKGLPYDSEPSR